MEISVVLPEPLGPSSPKISPDSISRDILSRIVVELPSKLLYILEIPLASTDFSVIVRPLDLISVFLDSFMQSHKAAAT